MFAMPLVRAIGAISALMLASSLFAFWGPPYFVDDPEPANFHHWESYLALTYANGKQGVSAQAPLWEFNYGGLHNVHLHVLTQGAYNVSPGNPKQHGYGDTEVGFKWKFQSETTYKPSMAIFPVIEVPTGSPSLGLGNGKTQAFLPLWMERNAGKWQVNWGGGYWLNPGQGNRNYWISGVQFQNQVRPKLSLGAEIFNTTPSTDSSAGHTSFNFGAVYDADEGHHWLLSLGRDLHGQTTAQFYLGFQWTWGPAEK